MDLETKDKIISTLARQVESLVESHWNSIDKILDDDREVKLAISAGIATDGDSYLSTVNLSFSPAKIKDSSEATITGGPELDFGDED